MKIIIEHERVVGFELGETSFHALEEVYAALESEGLNAEQLGYGSILLAARDRFRLGEVTASDISRELDQFYPKGESATLNAFEAGQSQAYEIIRTSSNPLNDLVLNLGLDRK